MNTLLIHQNDVTDLNYQLPTDDGDVRSLLRSLQEPITLFGEDKLDRRSRLIKLISGKELYDQIVNGDVSETESMSIDEDEEDEEYFEPVSEDPVKCDELYELRINITKFSLHKAKDINIRQFNAFHNFDMTEELISRRELYEKLSHTELSMSKLLSTRPISHIKFHNEKILTTSWDGDLKILLNDDNLTELKLYKEDGRTSRLALSEDTIITGNFEGCLNFYNTDGHSYKDQLHETRISDLLIHPLQQLLITSSFDKTFKLYDLTKQQEVYQQFKAHSKEIFRIGLNSAGSLLSTCGLDSAVRVWDLRSGKLLVNLLGHQDGVYSNAWHPDGHHLITGSSDCTVKIWDLRNPQLEMVNLPQHDKLVSDLSISEDGKWFISSGYDAKIKMTSFDSFIPIKTLQGHDDKIISVDVNSQNQIISSGWDRSLKLWQSI